MTRTLNLYDAKNQLSRLVDASEGGEVVVIARNGRPAAKLVPLSYGEGAAWSDTIVSYVRGGKYDGSVFDVDRSDVLPAPEQGVF